MADGQNRFEAKERPGNTSMFHTFSKKFSVHSSTMKMDEEDFSEMSVNIYQIIRRHIPVPQTYRAIFFSLYLM
jgi:hypothetical protein